MITYICHYVTDATVTVNQASVEHDGSLMVQVVNGTVQLDLVGSPADLIEFAARLVDIATKATADRARAQMDPIPDAGQLREAHTPMDRSTLLAAGVDPSTVQPREHDVACAVCMVGTWNLSGYCDSHYVPPAHAAKIADQIRTVTA